MNPHYNPPFQWRDWQERDKHEEPCKGDPPLPIPTAQKNTARMGASFAQKNPVIKLIKRYLK